LSEIRPATERSSERERTLILAILATLRQALPCSRRSALSAYRVGERLSQGASLTTLRPIHRWPTSEADADVPRPPIENVSRHVT